MNDSKVTFNPKSVEIIDELSQLRFFSMGEGQNNPDIVEGEILHLKALKSYEVEDIENDVPKKKDCVEFMIFETGEKVKTTHRILGRLLIQALESSGNLRILYKGLLKGSKGKTYHGFEGHTFNLK